MDTPQHRLDAFIKAIFGTKKEFTDYIERDPTWTTKYTGNGKSIIQSKEILDKLEQKGLNIVWYHEGTGEMLLKKNTSNAEILHHSISQEEYTREIPFITVRANAGEGFTYSDLDTAYVKERRPQYSPTCKMIRINGDSMLPFPSGSIIVFDEAIQPQPGEMVIAQVDGQLMFKKFEIIDGIQYLTSLNTAYEPIKLNGFRNWQILGTYVANTP